MKNFFLFLLKIVVIYVVAILGAWLFKNLFNQLYVFIIKPDVISPTLFLIGDNFVFNFLGALIAYSFFASLLSFVFVKERKCLVWIIVLAPLLLISFSIWSLFIWYLAMAVIAWLFAQGILLIYKQVKK